MGKMWKSRRAPDGYDETTLDCHERYLKAFIHIDT